MYIYIYIYIVIIIIIIIVIIVIIIIIIIIIIISLIIIIMINSYIITHHIIEGMLPLERTGPAERRTKRVKLPATFLHHGSLGVPASTDLH